MHHGNDGIISSKRQPAPFSELFGLIITQLEVSRLTKSFLVPTLAKGIFVVSCTRRITKELLVSLSSSSTVFRTYHYYY